MGRKRKRGRRFAIAAVLAGVIASGAYALTASNTVPSSNAGSGSGTISGYTVSSVSYTLNSANPQNIDKVSFALSPAGATTVKAQLVTGGTWYSCTLTAGTWGCDTTSPSQATAAAANNLTVVASQ
ncbi:MAG TPA: hypothetical protein VH416_01535 [Gaiellaceae bacterium]